MKNIHKSEGFTLIELMIVVAIIGVLSMIAFPAYQDYINKTRMTEYVSVVSNQLRKAYTTRGTGDFTYAAESWSYNSFAVEGCIDAGYSTGRITGSSNLVPILTSWGVSNSTAQWLYGIVDNSGASFIVASLIHADSSCQSANLVGYTISPYNYLARISLSAGSSGTLVHIGSSLFPSIDGEDPIFCYISNRTPSSLPNPLGLAEVLRMLPKSCHYIGTPVGIIPIPN